MSFFSLRYFLLILTYCLYSLFFFGLDNSYALPSSIVSNNDSSEEDVFFESDGREDFINWDNQPIDNSSKNNKEIEPVKEKNIINQDDQINYDDIDVFLESDGGDREKIFIPKSKEPVTTSNKKELIQIKEILRKSNNKAQIENFLQPLKQIEPFNKEQDNFIDAEFTDIDEEIIQNQLTEEEIAEADTMVFDLYLSDKLLGLTIVNYTDNWQILMDVDGLLEQIKAHVKDPNKLRPLLEGKIENTRKIKGIGVIKFDPYTFHVEVIPDKNLLTNELVKEGIGLPSPKNDFAFQQSFNVTASGKIQGEQNATAFTHRSMASVGRWFANVEGTFINDNDNNKSSVDTIDPYSPIDNSPTSRLYNDNDKYDLNEAIFGVTVDNYQMGLGADETDGDVFVGSSDYLGFFFKTKEETFLDRDKLHGSRLTIFVPSRSRVEFFQGSRLISTKILDFGVQDIDTTDFPHGSYDVDIVMHQDNGTVTRDRQFFTKSGHLTIRSHPIITLRGGVLRDNLDFYQDKKIYQGSLRIRSLSFLENDISVQGLDNIHIGGIGSKVYLFNYLLEGRLLYSNEHNFGYQGSLSGSLLGLDWYINHSETDSKKKDEDLNNAIFLSKEEQAIEAFNAIAKTRRTTNASVSKSLGSLILRMRATKNKYSDNDNYAYGPEARWDIMRDFRNTLSTNATYTKTNTGDQYYIGISYNRRLSNTIERPNHQFSVNTTTQQNGGSTQNQVRTAYEYNDRDVANKGTRILTQNEINNRRDKKNQTIINNEVRFDYANDYIDTYSFINSNNGSDTNNVSYGINAGSSFILDKSLIPKVAYPFKDDAAVVVIIESDNSNELIDVLINGGVKTTVTAGKRTIIGLPAYETYRVSIRPKEQNEFVLYDSSERQFTLFPGNIVLESWKISKMFIAIGRLFDKEGSPMEWKRIMGTTSYTTTEEDGFFQAELSGDEKLYVEDKNGSCFIQLPPIANAKFSVDVGDVICK